MKCKVCGCELSEGSLICKFCGSPVAEEQLAKASPRTPVRPVEDVDFTWNTFDFPKPKKPEDIEMSWPQFNVHHRIDADAADEQISAAMASRRPVSIMRDDATEGFVSTNAAPQQTFSRQVVQPVPPMPPVQPMAPVQPVQPQMQQPQPQIQPAAPVQPQVQFVPVWTMPAQQPLPSAEPMWYTQPVAPVQPQVVPVQYVPVYAQPMQPAGPYTMAMQRAGEIPGMPTRDELRAQAPASMFETAREDDIAVDESWIKSQLEPEQKEEPAPAAAPEKEMPASPAEAAQAEEPAVKAPINPWHTIHAGLTGRIDPVIEPAMDTRAAAEPEPEVIPEPVAEPEPAVTPEPEHAAEPELAEVPEAAVESEPVSEPEPITEPEPVAEPEPAADPIAEALEEPDPANRERFYTFNKKNEEFQALLDAEYARVKAMRLGEGEEAPATAAEIAKSAAPVAPLKEEDKDDDDAPLTVESIISSKAPGDSSSTRVWHSEEEDIPAFRIPDNILSQPAELQAEELSAFESMLMSGTSSREDSSDETIKINLSKVRESTVRPLAEDITVPDFEDIPEEQPKAKAPEAPKTAALANDEEDFDEERRRAEELERQQTSLRKQRLEEMARAREEYFGASLQPVTKATSEVGVIGSRKDDTIIKASEKAPEKKEEPKQPKTEKPAEKTVEPKQAKDEKPAEKPAKKKDDSTGFDDYTDKDYHRSRGGWLLKLILIIIILALLLEGAKMMAVRFMPESTVTVFLTDLETDVVTAVTNFCETVARGFNSLFKK